MKIADYISKCIQEFPTLFKSEDYEISKLKVLDSIFFTIGSGDNMADTENPDEGGYVIRKNNRKKTKDKPYGVVKYKALPKDYFKHTAYYVSTKDCLEDVIIRREENGGKDVVLLYNSTYNDRMPRLVVANNPHPFSPYPISIECSLVGRIYLEKLFLQPDWMEELIFLCNKSLEFYNDENQYVNHFYYPTPKKVKGELIEYEKHYGELGLSGINTLQKRFGYTIKDTLPDYEEIKTMEEERWKSYKEEQINILTAILKSFL